MHKGINTTVDEGQTPIITTGGGFDEKSTLAFPWQLGGTQQMRVDVDVSPPLLRKQTPAVLSAQGPSAYDIHGVPATSGATETSVHVPLRARPPGQSEASTTTVVSYRAGVRRLTPTECERLQGFPDGWTDVPYRGKPATDGPRYKAIGNSMAVPVMRWIGERIKMVDEQLQST